MICFPQSSSQYRFHPVLQLPHFADESRLHAGFRYALQPKFRRSVSRIALHLLAVDLNTSAYLFDDLSALVCHYSTHTDHHHSAFERLIQIPENIIDIFETNAQADEIRADACGNLIFRAQLAVCGGGGMNGKDFSHRQRWQGG